MEDRVVDATELDEVEEELKTLLDTDVDVLERTLDDADGETVAATVKRS